MNNLPFDNLYKFMAISGLAILILIVGYEIESGRSRVEKSFQMVAEIEAIGVEIEYESEYLNYYRTIEKDEAKAKKYFLDLNKNIDLRNLKIKESEKISDYYRDFDSIMSIAVPLGMFCSLLLSIIGFILWYIKLQKYQDLLVLKESKKLRHYSDVWRVKNSRSYR